MLVGEFPRVVLGDSFVGTAGIVVHVWKRENEIKISQILNDINKITSRGNGQGKGEILRDSLNV